MNAWKLTISVLTVLIIFLGQVAAKPGNGNGGGNPGGEEPPPVETLCANKKSAFPSFAYTQIKRGRKNSVAGYDILLSNAAGDCFVLLVSVSDNSLKVNLKLKLSGSSGIVVWSQVNDETASKRSDAARYDLIRAVRFQAENNAVTSIDTMKTLLNSGSRDIEYSAIDLSSDGNTVLILQAEPSSSGVYVNSIREMDISSCSSNCSVNTIFSELSDKVLLDANYNDVENRIYYSGYYRGISSNGPLASQGFISFIEDQTGSWSAPRFLTIEGNGLYGIDFSASYTFPDIDVASVDLGNGVITEAVSHTFTNVATGQLDTHVIDVGSCSVSGSGDCLSSDESSLTATIADAHYSNFHSSSLLFSSVSTENIYQYNFNSSNLSLVASGNESDSAN